MSRQMKEMRGQLESDEQLKSLMAGLRGANVDDSDFADKDVVMQLVEVDRDELDQLPQVQSLNVLLLGKVFLAGVCLCQGHHRAEANVALSAGV